VRGRWLIASVVVMTAGIGVAGAKPGSPPRVFERGGVDQAPRQWPLAPVPPDGQRVAPFFDGFYENPDGTITLSFGYSNFNRTGTIEIPLGPNNFIEPKEYDGRQPTSFPVTPVSGDGGRRDRERGVFTITVPATFKGDVVWTLRHAGQTHKVPGRAKTGAYGLRWPMAMGSIPPLLGFTADGLTGRGPVGLESPPLQATVGTPLSVTIWTKDDSKRDDEIQVKERGPARNAINVNWYKHSGPGDVTFNPQKSSLVEVEGTATSAITFAQPGTYVLRVRSDNFGRPDTSAGNQCCWTNGYIRVTVK
jgi:hypothetical protein